MFVGNDEGKRIGQSVNVELKTFENQGKRNESITVMGLASWVQTLGMDQQKPLKYLRDEITALVKLINLELLRKQLKPAIRVTELNYDGFLEFLLQIAHWNFNAPASSDDFERPRNLKAYQLQEKLIDLLRTSSGRLNLPKRYFESSAEEKEIVDLLSEKLLQDPDYPLPAGYTKVQV
jgi:hypothetical protein